MQAPQFWFRPPGLVSTVLRPIGWLYGQGTAIRLARGDSTRIDIPVICVGNINVGGTGKTPTVMDLAGRLVAAGKSPHILSKGYGGKLEGPVQVDMMVHTAEDVGDEPLLLSAFAPTWVAKDRKIGAIAAAAEGADVLILDDGFQDPSLAKDLSLVVVDGARGFGNGLVLPAGPLREPVAVGLSRADLLLSIGGKFAAPTTDVPHIHGRLEPLETGMDWAGTRVLAFAGIGHPEKFFATLRGLGADLIKTEALEDHQPLTPAIMTRLEREATALGAQLVTTEKDAVRLPSSFRPNVLALPVRLKLDGDGPAQLDAALAALFS